MGLVKGLRQSVVGLRLERGYGWVDFRSVVIGSLAISLISVLRIVSYNQKWIIVKESVD